VIRSFKDSRTEKVRDREPVRAFGPDLQRAAQKKLRLLNAASERRKAMAKAHAPITPGAILLTEFLEPLGITQYRLAQATGLSQTCISEIVRGKRAITPPTGLRLSKALGVDDRFWINVQTDYEIEIELDRHGSQLDAVTALVVS